MKTIMIAKCDYLQWGVKDTHKVIALSNGLFWGSGEDLTECKQEVVKRGARSWEVDLLTYVRFRVISAYEAKKGHSRPLRGDVLLSGEEPPALISGLCKALKGFLWREGHIGLRNDISTHILYEWHTDASRWWPDIDMDERERLYAKVPEVLAAFSVGVLKGDTN